MCPHQHHPYLPNPLPLTYPHCLLATCWSSAWVVLFLPSSVTSVTYLRACSNEERGEAIALIKTTPAMQQMMASQTTTPEAHTTFVRSLLLKGASTLPITPQ